MEEKTLVQELTLPLFASKGWMKLLGVVMIIQGVVIALTLVGVVVCWLPIWLGMLLFKAAGYVEGAQLTGDKVQLAEALHKIKTFFVINGVLMLIFLIVAAIGLLSAGTAVFALLNDM